MLHAQHAALDGFRKPGEDVTKTLKMIPRLRKAIQTVCEKVSYRDWEKSTQAPVPFHIVPPAWPGRSFLAMPVFEKYG